MKIKSILALWTLINAIGIGLFTAQAQANLDPQVPVPELGSGEPPPSSEGPADFNKPPSQAPTQLLVPVPLAPSAGIPQWTPLGPAPIPNGQTTPPRATDPVSGRVTAIAIHPTNPNTVYVGTAQGGVYRSLDAGAHWTPLLDNALSLAVGAIGIAP